MANTIGEILKKKNESIYETYKRVLCKEYNNKRNDKDLCNITLTIQNEAKCINYERCMKNQCKTCKSKDICFKEE